MTQEGKVMLGKAMMAVSSDKLLHRRCSLTKQWCTFRSWLWRGRGYGVREGVGVTKVVESFFSQMARMFI